MTMSKKKILIIEDDPDLTWLLEYSLVKRGYKTFSAYDGKSGLLAAEIHQPDAITIDRMLPDMDGRNVCRLLPDRRVPVLFLTGRRGDPQCALCGQCAASTLTKPMSISELVNKMDILISQHRGFLIMPPSKRQFRNITRPSREPSFRVRD